MADEMEPSSCFEREQEKGRENPWKLDVEIFSDFSG